MEVGKRGVQGFSKNEFWKFILHIFGKEIHDKKVCGIWGGEGVYEVNMQNIKGKNQREVSRKIYFKKICENISHFNCLLFYW